MLTPHFFKVVVALALFLGRYTKGQTLTGSNFYLPGVNYSPEYCNIAVFAFSLMVLLCIICDSMKTQDCTMLCCCVFLVLVFLRALLSPWVADMVYDGSNATNEDAVVPMKEWGVSMWMLFASAIVCPVVCVMMKRK